MVCKFAVSQINKLKADGLDPTPEDIVRLNALGLKVEALKKKNAADSSNYLPRVAKISETIAFRQPTIGHDIWLDKIERITSPDFQSLLAVKAFALSRPSSELPDADDPKSVTLAIETFCNTMKDFTREQIMAAIEYVVYGADDTIGERPEKRKADEEDANEPDGFDDNDWKYCVSVGVLREGQAVLFGVTQAEMEAMPRRMLEDVIRRAYVFHNISFDTDSSDAEGDFYATLDSIRERLNKEKYGRE